MGSLASTVDSVQMGISCRLAQITQDQSLCYCSRHLRNITKIIIYASGLGPLTAQPRQPRPHFLVGLGEPSLAVMPLEHGTSAAAGNMKLAGCQVLFSMVGTGSTHSLCVV